VHRRDDTSNALGFLSAVASALENELVGKDARYIYIFTSSPSTQTAKSMSTVLVLGHDPAMVKKAGDLVKAQLGVKGGGKGTRWSGKYFGVWNESKENVVVKDILASLLSS